jgi:hypothetical protein
VGVSIDRTVCIFRAFGGFAEIPQLGNPSALSDRSAVFDDGIAAPRL